MSVDPMRAILLSVLAKQPARRGRRTRIIVGVFVAAVLAAATVAQMTADLAPTDLFDLAAEPYDPARFPDRNVADVVASAGGDDAATSRLLARLSPEATLAIDRSAIEEVATAIGRVPLRIEGVLQRTDELVVVLVRAEQQRYYVAVSWTPGSPERIEGLLVSPLIDVGAEPISDVELVLLAATVLAMVVAGLAQPDAGRWYVAAGVALCAAFAELVPWVAAQDVALLAVPAALVLAVAAMAERRVPPAVLTVVAVAAASSLLPVLAIDPGTGGAEFGHLLPIESLAGHVGAAQRIAAIAAIAASVTVLAWSAAGSIASVRAGRRGTLWRLGGGQLACASVAGVAIAGLVSPAPLDLTASGWSVAALLAVAGGRLAQLALRNSDLADVSARVADLGSGSRDDLTTIIGRALDDPTAQVLHARGGRFVDRHGRPAQLPGSPDRYTVLVVDGETVGAVVHDPATAADPERLRAACDAVKLSLANERLAAQIRWQLDEVRASRHRLVQAEDRARARLERDLHDGAQQRLTAAMLDLRVAQAEAATVDGALADRLEPIGLEIRRAIDEIRELARGVRPAALDGGLRAAADDLAERATMPVTVCDATERRAAPDTETVAYFVISEALTNAGRHSGAGHVDVSLVTEPGALRVTITDDGVGIAPELAVEAGERPPVTGGSGLVGLFDRVDAHGGTLSVRRGVVTGTTVEVTLPCGR